MTTASATKPRVLFACGGTNVYGFERVILTYIRGLHQLGFPLYCTVNGWNDGNFPRDIEAIGVPYESIKLGWFYLSKPWWTMDTMQHYPQALLAFRRVLRSFAPDLVIHSGYRSLASLAWLIGNRNVVAVQDYWSKPWEHRLVRRLDRRVRAYIACSDDIVRHLKGIGLPQEKIVRIYNPMTFGEAPRAINGRPGPVVFGIAGQIIERKGHHVAVEAMARVQKRLPDSDFRLKIYGSGDEAYIARVKAQAQSLGVSNQIDWCGYQSSCEDYYPEMDCALVMSTSPDPCPMAAIEPGAFGLPAITTTCGGLAELVIDGDTGYLIPAADADALADRMTTMILNASERRRMGERAFQANKRRFDSSVIMGQLAATLTNVANEGGTSVSNPQRR